MPTGYTARVASGEVTDLAPFVMQLARGMSALITMRDEPFDAPIPERFEPSTYHADEMTKAVEELTRLLAMSSSEAKAAAGAEFDEAVASHEHYSAVMYAKRERYDAMIRQLEAWQGAPPGIKEFGLQQLRESIRCDCDDPIGFAACKPNRKTRNLWRAEELAEADRQIEYHSREYANELARVQQRNAWLAQLRRSLGMETAK
jgi:hypothetical protein